MRLSPTWLREFVDLKVDDRRLADDLTLAGIAVESIQQSEGQTIFEMEITTNRPDAMNHYGVARECSAIYNLPLKPMAPKLPSAAAQNLPFAIDIQDKEGCTRYSARAIRNVKIGSSPERILSRLRIEEHGGVSNAVDASNYTLMEMGQPTHAFDLDKLEGRRIIVRRARESETLKTLDGVERKLTPEDLIIADERKPVGLAGVMGGLDSAISNSTKNILIEAAWFDPATVRRTARRLGMHTDASHIFERGADRGATLLACNRVAELILEMAGGELDGEPVDAIGTPTPIRLVTLRQKEISRLLGQEIPEDVVHRILSRLGFVLTPAKSNHGTSWDVTIPTWRLDVEREIDLLEELARVYGYDKFPDSLPTFGKGVVEASSARTEARLRQELLALGYNEAMSYTFISPANASAFADQPAVFLANPLSEEQSVMRTSLVPGMLDMIGWNLNRGSTDVRLFEAGHIFSLVTEKSDETKAICLGATGYSEQTGVHAKPRPYSFFDLKGDVEALLDLFETRDVRIDSPGPAHYHPGRSVQVSRGGEIIAQFGQLHPDLASARKLKQDIYTAELFLDRLLRIPLRVPRYQAASKYPAIDRDFSFVFDDSIYFEKIESTILALKIAELRSFAPAEIFRGGSVPQGKYSVLLRAQFQSNEQTLRDIQVAQWSSQMIAAMEAIGGSIRSS